MTDSVRATLKMGGFLGASVLQWLAGIVIFWVLAALNGIGDSPGNWALWAFLAGSVVAVVGMNAASAWIQRRSHHIPWPAWLALTVLGFLTLPALVILTWNGD